MRVLLVDGDAERATEVRRGLEVAGCTVVAIVPEATDLVRLVRDAQAEVVVCDLDNPSRDALESMGALHRDEPRPLILFASQAEPDQIEAALEVGVAAYVVEGLVPSRVRSVIEVAICRFRAQQAMRQQLDQAQTALAERKLIDRAKGILMQQRRIAEPEAYALLRRLAMDRGQRIAEVAVSVLRRK